VALVVSEVPEEYITSIIRETRIGKLGTGTMLLLDYLQRMCTERTYKVLLVMVNHEVHIHTGASLKNEHHPEEYSGPQARVT
jgi:hypothetical protein